MSPKSKLFDNHHLADAPAVDALSARLRREGFLSRKQAETLSAFLTSHAPCSVTVEMRMRKGATYLTLETPDVLKFIMTIDCKLRAA